MTYQLIIRKLATLLSDSKSFKHNRYANFDMQKEKEIIVWIRLQKGLAKDQIVDFIKNKFNTSDSDANRLYFKAYPDGIDKEEIKLIKEIDFECARMTPLESNEIIDNCCKVLLKEKDIDLLPEYKIDIPLVLDNLTTLLKNRNII